MSILLQPVDVVRDPSGSGVWIHPVFSQYYDETFGGIEYPTQEQWDGLLKNFGVEIKKIPMENDEHVPQEVFKRIYDEGDPDAIADWNPTIPEGKGWFLIAINDTEDGPAAWFARSLQDQISDLKDDLEYSNDNGKGWAENYSRALAEINQLKAQLAQYQKSCRFFSHDSSGNGFEYHNSLEVAKQESEAGLDYYRDLLGGDGHDIESDGDFDTLSYGIVLGSATYEVTNVVSEQDHKQGNFEKWPVGTQICSVSLDPVPFPPQHGTWINADETNRLVRELDVAINGEHGAALQASLGDIVAQVQTQGLKVVPAGHGILSNELTPLIRSVLGMMCFQIGHYAHVYQAAGFDIPKKAEDEQAFILHRWLLIALEHGGHWPAIAEKEIEELRAKTDQANEASQ